MTSPGSRESSDWNGNRRMVEALPAQPIAAPDGRPTDSPTGSAYARSDATVGATIAARFPIRLVVLDLDGTLIVDDSGVGPRTRSAVRKALDRGVVVAIATGRMPSSAMVFAGPLGLTAPLIGYQGALIRTMPKPGRTLGRILVHTPLSAAVAKEVIAWARSRGLDPHLNHLERFIIRADDPMLDDYSRFTGARAVLVPDYDAIDHPVTKILAPGEEALVAAALAEARVTFAGRAMVTISHPRFLEFAAAGVSKGRAVRWLARRLGVPLEQTMAIGDERNDLEMIAAVGHGVAMPTAPPDVRSVARYVAPPLEDEGAAQMIEALVLAGRAAQANADRLRQPRSGAA
jgi:Cof subfamily protein (haloacid dehalogenase superfamily)